ncbi:SH3 type 3 domain protein [Rivularia sp. IAM M-261]|nr:SH3 type 3 domain protein [Rivularia sp. IAM M-261]
MFIKDKICWKNHLIVTTSFLLAAQVFTYPSFAIITKKSQPFQPFTQNATFQDNQTKYLIARNSSNCRQVRTRNGLYVLDQQSIKGSVVGFLDYGQDVTIRNRGKNGFVPISSPIRGYVLAEFLNSCKYVTPALRSFCRQPVSDAGVVVRRKPSANAARVGVIPKGRNITINSRGRRGWVEVVLPFGGYVQSKNLGYCPEAL